MPALIQRRRPLFHLSCSDLYTSLSHILTPNDVIEMDDVWRHSFNYFEIPYQREANKKYSTLAIEAGKTDKQHNGRCLFCSQFG